MKPVARDFTARLKASAAQMEALQLASLTAGKQRMAVDCAEAAHLLAVVAAMLSDTKPLTNWDVIDTQLHKLLAAGDVPTPEEAEKIMAVQRMLREVSGE
jgi:hypothetical protein